MSAVVNLNMQHTVSDCILPLHVNLFNSDEYNSSLVQNMIRESFEAQSHIFYSLESYSMSTVSCI